MPVACFDPIGALRDRVTLTTATMTTDALRGQAATWATLATVWGEWLDRPSREALQAGALQNTPGKTLRIRHRTDVTVGMRATKGSTVCDIAAVRDIDGRRRYLELDLVETP